MTGPGLCGRCRHSRTVGNRRGSTFWLCGRSADDPRYPRYPVIPVLRCDGFEPEGRKGPGEGAGSESRPPRLGGGRHVEPDQHRKGAVEVTWEAEAREGVVVRTLTGDRDD